MINVHQAVGIIPARYASTRFPGKPLAQLGGMTMIERVYRQAQKALDNVVVATDDERIANAVQDFDGTCVMTSDTCRSGTDRCMEAYSLAKMSAEVVINIQGDEPFVAPEQISALNALFNNEETEIATLVRPVTSDKGIDVISDPNLVKVVIDKNMRAIYFSRSVIPYVRGVEQSRWPKSVQYYTHVGMYAYRAKILREITQLPQSTLEIAESLEQLRWVENGYKIQVGITEFPTIGIDTPEDLEAARLLLQG